MKTRLQRHEPTTVARSRHIQHFCLVIVTIAVVLIVVIGFLMLFRMFIPFD